jgi:hypothetical protein
VARHFSVRTFGVKPARLHEAELDALCFAHVALQVCWPPAKESTVLDVQSVVLMIAFIDLLPIPPVHSRQHISVKRSED